ncbi:MAG: hypothetical protein ACE5JN_15330 [Candidatus Methylomirabilia bacterium]
MNHFFQRMRAARAASEIVREEFRLTRIHFLRAGAVLAVGLVAVAAGFQLASGKLQTTATFVAERQLEPITRTYSHLDRLDLGRPATPVGSGMRAAVSPGMPTSHADLRKPHAALAAFTLVRVLMAEKRKRREASMGEQAGGTEAGRILRKAKPARHAALLSAGR